MTSERVRVNQETKQCVVMLKEAQQDRCLFIRVADPDAYAIAVPLHGNDAPPRPLTHDLLKTMLEGLGATLVRVAVSEIIDEIFYARMVLEVAGRPFEFDARPSDGFAEESVLEQSGVMIEPSEEQGTAHVAPQQEEAQEQ
jgi:bifunctional DNase/RNase